MGTIHYHGGGKSILFHRTVARRAETLSHDRLEALKQVNATGDQPLEQVLTAFIRPIFDLSTEEPRWRSYARLDAFVSADDRWREISAECFDPVAQVFMKEIIKRLPATSRQQVAAGKTCSGAMR